MRISNKKGSSKSDANARAEPITECNSVTHASAQAESNAGTVADPSTETESHSGADPVADAESYSVAYAQPNTRTCARGWVHPDSTRRRGLRHIASNRD